MAKEFYDISFKTYHNQRVKPVLFQGVPTHPLYLQMTYDRRTIFFKSYYFELFSEPKYAFLGTNIMQVMEMERRVLDFIIYRNLDRFELDDVQRQYASFSRDVLDSWDGPFKVWLGSFFSGQGMAGLAGLLGNGGQAGGAMRGAGSAVSGRGTAVAGEEDALAAVAGIRIWDDLKKGLRPGVFEKLEEAVFRDGVPYILLATYMRDTFPEEPFCLPAFVWAEEKNRLAIEAYLDSLSRRVDMSMLLRSVNRGLFPEGYWRFQLE